MLEEGVWHQISPKYVWVQFISTGSFLLVVIAATLVALGIAIVFARSCSRSAEPSGADAKMCSTMASSVIASPARCNPKRCMSSPNSWLFERDSPNGAATAGESNMRIAP